MTGLIDSSIQTQEYKDLEKMIDNLLKILEYRCDFYTINKDKIIDNIYNECNKSVVTGGRGTVALSKKTIDYKSVMPSKKRYNPVNMIEKSKDNVVNNIYIVNNHKKDKKLLTLNDIKNIPIGNEPYDSYFVSNKEFDIIANKMRLKAGISRPNKTSKKSVSKSRK